MPLRGPTGNSVQFPEAMQSKLAEVCAVSRDNAKQGSKGLAGHDCAVFEGNARQAARKSAGHVRVVLESSVALGLSAV